MLTIFMASASLACWVCTERTAQRGFGFTPAKGLAKLIDNVPHLLAFVASAGLAAQSPILGVVLLAMHNVVLLLLALMVRADTLMLDPHGFESAVMRWQQWTAAVSGGLPPCTPRSS